jgi:Family of unknown function (DUF5763)
MDRAMERNLSVNAVHGSNPDELNQVLSAAAPAPPEPPKPARDDQGPCLYLGEGGQRCSKRAIERGFCRSHQGQRDHLNVDADAEQPSEARKRAATPSKVLAASIGIIGILLPYVIDLVREIFRWIHSQ